VGQFSPKELTLWHRISRNCKRHEQEDKKLGCGRNRSGLIRKRFIKSYRTLAKQRLSVHTTSLLTVFIVCFLHYWFSENFQRLKQAATSASEAATICPRPLKVETFQASPFRRYEWFLVTALSGLMTLTFDLLTMELVQNISRGTDNLPPILVYRRLSVEL